MAYEYECEEVIKNVIKELIYFKKGKNELAEKEIDEIYAKAKAFDEIVNIEDNYNKEKGFSPCVEEYSEEVEDIISKYMEDKQND